MWWHLLEEQVEGLLIKECNEFTHNDETRFPSQSMWSHGKGEHGSSCHPRSKPVDCWITCIAETGRQVEQTLGNETNYS